MLKKRRATGGYIENLGLDEIAQTLSLGMKTACVTLTSNGQRGQVWFEKGAPRHAVTGRVEGESAFYAMVGWRTGRFAVEHGVRCRESTLEKDSMYLVMEGLRRLDESEAPGQPAIAPAPGGRRKVLLRSFEAVVAVALLSTIGFLLHVRNIDGAEAGPSMEHVGPVYPRYFVPSSPVMARASATPEPPRDALEPVVVENVADTPEADPAPPAPPAAGPPAPETMPSEAVATEETLQEEEMLMAGGLPGKGPAQEAAYLDLDVKSSVRAGELILLLDGAEVYRRALLSENGGVKRFFKKLGGRATETFGERLTLPPGQHDVVVRVVVDRRSYGYERSVDLDLDSGSSRTLRIVAGRTVGKRLALKLD